MNYKFNEDKLIKELEEYVNKTYDQHYATDKYQATDVIIDSGHGTGFCLGNVIKYAKRYGRKGNDSEARKDLMKILHYTLIQLYIHDEENKLEDTVRTTTPKEWYDLYSDLIPTCPTSARLNDATPEEWDAVSKKSIGRGLYRVD